MPDTIKLKKYSNRRLYDTEQSCYVTLNQVADLIKQGRKIEVIDAKSKQDVTAFVLIQIIMEESKKNNNLLPLSLMHLMIQSGGTVLQEFFEKYLYQTLEKYLSHKAKMDDHFSKMMGIGLGLPGMAGTSMYEMFSDYTTGLQEAKDQKRTVTSG
jgi:polyhydroxyalkanoate synthesis repressor PhaR